MPLSSYQLSILPFAFSVRISGSAKGGLMMEDCGLWGMGTVHLLIYFSSRFALFGVYLCMRYGGGFL